ncbi:MAG: polysaccharide deacetylase family protein [Candidatus Firestonebacteria bacterium]|nr:polysaccharide deacetylase family protein [Candidatus Firestonebacteria bacterium]
MNLPILMYHRISPQPDPGSDLTVTPGAFQTQLRYLREHGYASITLEHLARACRGEARLPRRSVVITFDDAYASLLEHAHPLLTRSGYTATVFAVAQALGRHNFWDDGKGVPRETCLGRAELAALQGQGWEIGSHGLSHANLAGLAPEALRRETADSRSLLEEALQSPVNVFAYPFGSWDAAARAAVAQAGYAAACAISPGTRSVTADLFALRRVYVKPTDSNGDFARKLSGWYLAYRALKRR